MYYSLPCTAGRQKFTVGIGTYIHDLWAKSDIHIADEYAERIPLEYRKFLKD